MLSCLLREEERLLLLCKAWLCLKHLVGMVNKWHGYQYPGAAAAAYFKLCTCHMKMERAVVFEKFHAEFKNK